MIEVQNNIIKQMQIIAIHVKSQTFYNINKKTNLISFWHSLRMFVNVILNINLKFTFPKMFLNNHITTYPQIKTSSYGSLLIPETLCLTQKHFTCESCSFSRWNRFETDGDISRSDSIWRNISASWRYSEKYCLSYL